MYVSMKGMLKRANEGNYAVMQSWQSTALTLRQQER